jgi:nitrogen regulatory protein P-II 1
MKKIEAIIRPGKLDEIKSALSAAGFHGMTVNNVLGCGRQKGHTQIYRGQEVLIQLLPKIKLELVIPDDKVKQIITIIRDSANTGKVGDGKIFVYPVENALRIRTGEDSENAI